MLIRVLNMHTKLQIVKEQCRIPPPRPTPSAVSSLGIGGSVQYNSCPALAPPQHPEQTLCPTPPPMRLLSNQRHAIDQISQAFPVAFAYWKQLEVTKAYEQGQLLNKHNWQLAAGFHSIFTVLWQLRGITSLCCLLIASHDQFPQ